jgi:hypothetical protein
MRTLPALPALLLAAAPAAQPVDTTTVVVGTEVTNTIDRRLFGQFMERPNWTLETGPEAAYDEATGTLAAGVIDAMRTMDIPVIRWPGGTGIDHMNWTDMIDNAPDREEPGRPISRGWGDPVSNDFGMDEALDLTESLGAETILVVNLLDALAERKTVEEAALHAAGLVAYANAEVGADLPEGMPDYPAIREQNGRAEPWDVRYVQIGNETWLYRDEDGQIMLPQTGSVDPEVKARYFASLRAYIDAIRAVDPDIEVIVDGHTGDTNDELQDRYGDEIDYVAVHTYYPWRISSVSVDGTPVDDARAFMMDPANREAIWQAMVAPRRLADDGTAATDAWIFDRARATGYPVAVTEWNYNTWIDVSGNGVGDSGGVYDPMGARGLGAMTMLHELMRWDGDIALATQSMLVGERWLIAAIRYVPTADITFRNVSGIGMGLYSRLHGTERVALTHDGLATYDQPLGLSAIQPKDDVAFLDPVVTRSADSVYVHLINRRYASTDTSLVRLDLSAYPEVAATATHHTMHVLTGFGVPQGDNPYEGAWVTTDEVPVGAGNVVEFRVPPHSVSVVAIARSGGTAAERGPEGFRVGPPRPNPARDAVAFEVDLAAPAAVGAVVYDVLGRAVLEVTPRPLAAGRQSVRVPTAALPAGVYVVRLAAEGEPALRAARTVTVVR